MVKSAADLLKEGKDRRKKLLQANKDLKLKNYGGVLKEFGNSFLFRDNM